MHIFIFTMVTPWRMPVSVLLANDSDVMLKAMRKFLEEDLRIEVVGEACLIYTYPEHAGSRLHSSGPNLFPLTPL